MKLNGQNQIPETLEKILEIAKNYFLSKELEKLLWLLTHGICQEV